MINKVNYTLREKPWMSARKGAGIFNHSSIPRVK